MKVKINGKEFRGLIEILKKISKKESFGPYVMFKANDSKFEVFVLRNTRDLFFKFNLPASIISKGIAILDLAKNNFKSLGKLSKHFDEVIFERIGDNLRINDLISLELIDDYYEKWFNWGNLIDLGNQYFSLNKHLIFCIFSKMLDFIPKKHDNRVLENLCINFIEDRTYFVTSDGYKLYSIFYKIENKEFGQVLIPGEVVNLILAFAKNLDWTLEKVTFSKIDIEDRLYVLIQGTNFEVFVEQQYENFPSRAFTLLEEARLFNKYKVILNRKEIVPILEAFLIVSEFVNLTFEPFEEQQAKLILEDPYGKMKKEILVQYVGDNFKIAVNVKYFLDILAFYKDSNKIFMAMNSVDNPIYFALFEDEALLMPVKPN